MPDWWLPYVGEFVRRVRALSMSTPIRVTSWGRTRSHNTEVGGVTQSQHLLFTAADLVPLGGAPLTAIEQAARASGAFGYVLNEGDHVHVQLWPGGVIPTWIYDEVAT